MRKRAKRFRSRRAREVVTVAEEGKERRVAAWTRSGDGGVSDPRRGGYAVIRLVARFCVCAACGRNGLVW